MSQLSASSPLSESRQIVLDLHSFLNDLEPSRWKAAKTAALHQRLTELQQRMAAFVSAHRPAAPVEPLTDDAPSSSYQLFARMHALLTEHAPSALSPSDTSTALKDAWMALREHAEPAYESLAASLKRESVIVPSLRPTNYTRNLFHVGAALTCILIVELVPALTPWGFDLVMWLACGAAIAGWGMEISRRVSERANAFLMWVFSLVAHPHEAHHVNSATWYVTALAMLSLTRSPAVCAIALAVLGVADPAAAIIGKRWGRTRFENGRSVEGTAAFTVVGTLGALGVIFAFHAGILSLPVALLTSFVAALCAGLTELSLKRIDDNLAIPVAAGAAAWVVLASAGFSGLL